MPPLKLLPNDSSASSSTSWDFSTVFEFLDALKDKAGSSSSIIIDDDVNDYYLLSQTHHDRAATAAALITADEVGRGEGLEVAQKKDANGKLRVSLGDFSKLWDALGVKYDLASVPTVPAFESAISTVSVKEADAYTSDGPLSYPPSLKTVRWKDDNDGGADEDGGDVADTNPDTPPEADSGGLTKDQKKKRNKKLRKATQSVSQAGPTSPRIVPAASVKKESKDSGDDSVSDSSRRPPPSKNKQPVQPSTPVKPTYQSSDNNAGSTGGYSLRSSSKKKENAEAAGPSKQSNVEKPKLTQPTAIEMQSKAVEPSDSSPKKAAVAAGSKQVAPAKNEPCKDTSKLLQPPGSNASASKPNRKQQTSAKTDIPVTPTKQQKVPTAATAANKNINKWPIANPQHTSTRPVQQLPPPPHPPSTLSPLTPTTKQSVLQQSPVPSAVKKQAPLTPIKHQSSVDRNWSLLLKLMHSFPEDKAFLLSPLQLSINRAHADGIHVFVDASNILIGFQDHLKRARGLSLAAHVPPVDLNFHALALLLERRRPVAKRVLAGSTPEIPAFEAARQVGYETNILDKVWKAKEMSERQRFFAANGNRRQHRSNSNIANNKAGSSGYQSESDSAALFGYASSDGLSSGRPAQQALHPHKWVEQAVDEILHLKILESIIDTPPPTTRLVTATEQPHGLSSSPPGAAAAVGASSSSSTTPAATVVQRPTMILATGDAAEAEYSSGFLKMVQRALSHGWNVEVAAWADNISMGYRRLQHEADRIQAERGERRFRIIELDGFADELFGGGAGELADQSN